MIRIQVTDANEVHSEWEDGDEEEDTSHPQILADRMRLFVFNTRYIAQECRHREWFLLPGNAVNDIYSVPGVALDNEEDISIDVGWCSLFLVE